MKKTQRILALVLSFILVCSGMLFTTAMAENEPYYVTHEVKTIGGTTQLIAEVYLTGVVGVSGNLALDLVDEALEFEPAATLAETVVAADGVVVAKVAEATETVLAGGETIAFSWYGESGTKVDATEEAVLLATITYTLKADGDVSTLGHVETEERTHTLFAEAADVSELAHFVGKPARVMTADSEFVDGVAIEAFEVIPTTTKASSGSLTIGWEKDPNYEYVDIDLVKVDDDGNPIEEVGTQRVPMEDGKYKWTGLKNGDDYVATITPVNVDGGGNVTESGVPSQVAGTPKKSSSGVTVVVGGSTKYDVDFTAGDGEFEDGKKKVTVEVERNSKINSKDVPEITPPEGKKLVGWTVDGETLINFDTYKITGDVKLIPVFADIEDADKAYHYDYISGYEDGTVKPGANIKRSEAAAIIAKVSTDFDAKAEYEIKLSDVKEGEWYAAYVGYCADNGIITGYTDGTFRPNEYITRAEFTVMISRMLALELTADGSFPDTGDHWANAYIMALKAAGMVDGYTDGTFKPENDITRAEAVKIVNRAIDRVPSKERLDRYVEDEGNPFKDLDENFWGFYDVIEAAVPHEVIDYHE